MNHTASHPRDKWIPWCFVAFFLGLFAVDGVMVWLAVGTQTGLVTEHAYEKGLAYNRVVAAEQAQEALGWQAEIALTSHRLQVTLRDKTGAMIAPDSLIARFTRPTQDGMDFAHDLSHQGRAEIEFPARGLWEVRIYAVKDGQKFQQAERITVE